MPPSAPSSSMDSEISNTRQAAESVVMAVDMLALASVLAATTFLIARAFRSCATGDYYLGNCEFLLLTCGLLVVLFLVASRPSILDISESFSEEDQEGGYFATLPQKVKDVIMPSLNKFHNTFKDDKETDRSGEEIDFVMLEDEKLDLGEDECKKECDGTEDETCEDADSCAEKDEEDRDSGQNCNFGKKRDEDCVQDLKDKYDNIGFLLCRLKHANRDMYEDFMSLKWI